MVVLGLLAILGVWLLLDFELAEGALIFIVLTGVGLAVYWAFIGRWGTDTVKGVAVFGFIVAILGFVRLGIEILSNVLFGKHRI